MKKVKSLLSLLALSGILFTACNNGDYNADPNANQSDVPNPFEYGGATVGGPGYIKANFNDQEFVFSPAVWIEHPELGRAVAGKRINKDGPGREEFSVVFNSFPGTGDTVFNAEITYTVFENDTTLKEQYANDFTGNIGTAVISGFDWYKMTGRFQGILDQNYPFDSSKVIVLTQGFFDTGKQ